MAVKRPSTVLSPLRKYLAGSTHRPLTAPGPARARACRFLSPLHLRIASLGRLRRLPPPDARVYSKKTGVTAWATPDAAVQYKFVAGGKGLLTKAVFKVSAILKNAAGIFNKGSTGKILTSTAAAASKKALVMAASAGKIYTGTAAAASKDALVMAASSGKICTGTAAAASKAGPVMKASAGKITTGTASKRPLVLVRAFSSGKIPKSRIPRSPSHASSTHILILRRFAKHERFTLATNAKLQTTLLHCMKAFMQQEAVKKQRLACTNFVLGTLGGTVMVYFAWHYALDSGMEALQVTLHKSFDEIADSDNTKEKMKEYVDIFVEQGRRNAGLSYFARLFLFGKGLPPLPSDGTDEVKIGKMEKLKNYFGYGGGK